MNNSFPIVRYEQKGVIVGDVILNGNIIGHLPIGSWTKNFQSMLELAYCIGYNTATQDVLKKLEELI